jgi:nucleotide-binding universal stress UspA family protein
MFKKLLVPLDRSRLAEQAIGRAASLARAAGAAIDLVLVHEPFPFGGFKDMPWASDDWMHDEQYLESIAVELRAEAGVEVTHSVLQGAPAEMIALRANEVKADLIVMTSHGRTGLSRAWLGSVADALVRHASIPVLMLRAAEAVIDRSTAAPPFKHILVPHDGSALAADVLPTAIDLARANGARISLFRVVPPVPLATPLEVATPFATLPLRNEAATDKLATRFTREIEDAATRLADREMIDVRANVVVNVHSAEAIVDFARAHDVDAIAMSTHGHGVSRWLLGSVADKVVRGAEVPVLLRRPTGAREKHLITDQRIAEQLPALAGE